MALIPLTKGVFAEVDDDDVPVLRRHRWQVVKARISRSPYAMTRIDGKTVYMHRLLLAAPSGTQVDHKDLDGLNNTRANLRLATRSDQKGNSQIPTSNTSGFKGVYRDTKGNRWRAQIHVGGTTRRLGSHRTPESAAHSYDEAARLLFGDFARLNFPAEGSQERGCRP